MALALAATAAAHAITPAEKALLQGAISHEQARMAGSAGDVATFLRIVEKKEPRLIEAYGSGLGHNDMPAEVEVIVIRHFNDGALGASLRRMGGRYRSRQLFDLHARRVHEATQVSEPSFWVITNTNQEGIEEDLVRLSAKQAPSDTGVADLVLFVGRRRHPAALPHLLKAVGTSFGHYGHSGPLEVLLQYPSREVWLRTAAEIESAHALGKIKDEHFQKARARIEALLREPEAAEKERHLYQAIDEFRRRTSSLPFEAVQIEALQKTDLAAYVARKRLLLVAQEPLAASIHPGVAERTVAESWLQLGFIARFRLRDARVAAELFRRAMDLGAPRGAFALADALQVGVGDAKGAVAAYRRALAQAEKPRDARWLAFYGAPTSRRNAFWQEWLRHEIAFLEGRAKAPVVSEAAVGGFFEVVGEDAMANHLFSPEFTRYTGGPMFRPAGAEPDSVWVWPLESKISGITNNLARGAASKPFDAFPASRWAWTNVLPYVSLSGDPELILRFLRSSDPSGYWSASAMGLVAYLDGYGEGSRDEAVRSQAVELLPALILDESSPALSLAAKRFLAERGLAVRRR